MTTPSGGPRRGGTYVRDPKTGRVKRTGGTEEAPAGAAPREAAPDKPDTPKKEG